MEDASCVVAYMCGGLYTLLYSPSASWYFTPGVRHRQFNAVAGALFKQTSGANYTTFRMAWRGQGGCRRYWPVWRAGVAAVDVLHTSSSSLRSVHISPVWKDGQFVGAAALESDHLFYLSTLGRRLFVWVFLMIPLVGSARTQPDMWNSIRASCFLFGVCGILLLLLHFCHQVVSNSFYTKSVTGLFGNIRRERERPPSRLWNSLLSNESRRWSGQIKQHKTSPTVLHV